MRRIGVVTGGRADYGILRSVLREIAAAPDLELVLYVCGMHLASRFGDTVREIEQDGFPVSARVDTLADADTAVAAAEAIGRGVVGFARAFQNLPPDILFLTGDRTEMLSAACAALPLLIPIAHLHGGELTEGAIDDAIRHALTKFAHLHFVSTQAYAARVLQLGEEPARVHVTGGPGLDNLRQMTLLDETKLRALIGMPLDPAPLLCTFHPVTLEPHDTMRQLHAMLEALAAIGRPVVFTYPNSDPQGAEIIAAIEQFSVGRSDRLVVANLGTRAYFSLAARAAAIVGNSSSGIVEAASFALPVVNVGSRQGGRVRAANVIDVAPTQEAILAGLRRAIAPAFRAGLAGMTNPYGDGYAASRIIEVLRTVSLGTEFIHKRFCEFRHAA